MRSILTVTEVADSQDLTTVDTVKQELGLAAGDSSQDALIGTLIHQCSDIVAAHLGRVLGEEAVTETFWPEAGAEWLEYLFLDRYPVSEIATVTVDDVELTSSDYRLDSATGILYRLDESGYPSAWDICKAAVISYTGGYELLDSVPWALERGTVLLVKESFAQVGRDPRVRSEEIPGLGSVDYWVGSVGKSGQLSPDVITMISPFRRPRL
jgi:hypothetical protein